MAEHPLELDQEQKSGYTPSQKKAILKYAKTHPDKIKLIQKRYNDKRWQNDVYREEKKAYMREYYQKNKELLKQRQKNIKKDDQDSPVDPINNIQELVDPVNNPEKQEDQEQDPALQRKQEYMKEYYRKNKDKIRERYLEKKRLENQNK